MNATHLTTAQSNVLIGLRLGFAEASNYVPSVLFALVTRRLVRRAGNAIELTGEGAAVAATLPDNVTWEE